MLRELLNGQGGSSASIRDHYTTENKTSLGLQLLNSRSQTGLVPAPMAQSARPSTSSLGTFLGFKRPGLGRLARSGP